ncbi:MAG TPA: glycerol-3-phosphate dehydrogenase/oxidase [Acidimicrobiales bacterium]|nr:glycerol-3-phosphate dehydrogenase/oxidase [Acidimicrobiales bacterium]
MTGAFARAAALDRMTSEHYDVLVIGGGITGAGVALDAAARGLRTALLERRDFAAGTSSKSSKLVHGGLRYLQQRELRLVRANLAERQRLLANAPHLVRPLAFVVPLLGAGGVVSEALARGYSTALWAYDLSGGVRIGHRHRRLPPGDVLAALPALARGRVASGFEYHDAFADDARLTLAVVRTAVLDHGAVAANHAPVAGLLSGGGRVHGAVLEDGSEVRAGVVVNAAGVWADQVDALHRGDRHPMLRPAKGIHVTVERSRLPVGTAAVLPVPGDGRSIFVVPWGDRVYIGTTDTEYAGALDDPPCTADDVAYLLAAANAAVAEPLRPSDVVGTWAGLRPLLDDVRSKRTSDLSRRHRVTADANMVTVTGGKLTTYRRMAADAVDRVVAILGRGARRSPTAKIRLHGSLPSDPPGAGPLDAAAAAHLASRYGSEASIVAALVAADPDLARPLVPGLPYLRAEAVHAARAEMAHTLDDVLSRRTRARILARDASSAAATDVARLLAPELGWSPARAADEAAAYVAASSAERAAAGLAPTVAGPSQ